MMNSINIVPEMLNETNYDNWSVRLRTYLQAQDIWDVIEEETIFEETNDKCAFRDWKKRNAKALYAIHVSCDTRAFLFIRDIGSAKIAWNILEEKFGSSRKDEHEHVPRLEIKSETYHDHDEKKMPESKQISERMPRFNSSTLPGDHVDLGAFFDAARFGDLSFVKHFVEENPDAVRAIHPFYNQTALHIASISGRFHVVEELVSKMREEDLEIRAANGYTALAISTISGDTRIAECMVRRNRKIVSIWDDILEFVPLEFALLHGHIEMSRYLYSVTPLEALIREKQAKHGATVITYCIYLQCYDIAFDLIRRCPSLTVAPDHCGTSPIYALTLTNPSAFRSGCEFSFWEQWIYNRIRVKEYDHAKNEISIQVKNLEVSQAKARKITYSRIQHIYELKLAHLQSSTLLNHFCKVIRDLDQNQVKKALVDKALHESAARGIEEFFSAVLRANPELIRSTKDSGQSVFMKAVEFRQPKIFCLVYGTASMKAWTSMVDHCGNTMLHKAGLLAPRSQLSKIPGAALQMQSELQWFKEVESIILPHHLELRNSSGYTARELFTKTHKDLMTDGEKWMKDTASSCSLVASLIATIMFTVAFTVPGGSNQDTGFPIFSERKLFKIFVVSDAVSLFSSTASVLMFLGILTSRYAEQDFLESLPAKLVVGLSTLFFSIATMTVAFCAALFLVLRCKLWFVGPTLVLALVPVTLFGWMQFPLLIQIFYNTYGPSIFDRKVEQWL